MSVFDHSCFCHRQIRLPGYVSDEVDEDPTGNKALWDRGRLNGASQKADILANFHLGETVTSLQKATLIPGGSESLVYTSMSGGIGMLVPFTSNQVSITICCLAHSLVRSAKLGIYG